MVNLRDWFTEWNNLNSRTTIFIRYGYPKNCSNSESVLAFRHPFFVSPPFLAERTPKWMSWIPPVLWASGFMEIKTSFSSAYGIQVQSMSSRYGFAFSSMETPLSAQASIISWWFNNWITWIVMNNYELNFGISS